MTETFLLEIGLEEVPARFVRSSSEQLKERVVQFLKENRLTFGEVQTYATPRRFAVQIKDLADKQEDITEKAKGPSKKIALDADGNWTKAAQGFVRGQGLTTEDIYFESIKGVDYIHVNKEIKGHASKEILQTLPDVIASMTFPVTMHWGSSRFEFIRPVHWLVVLFGADIVPCSFIGIHSDRISKGHRFLGQEAVIDHADHYAEKLREQFVIADLDERKAMIKKQLAHLEEVHNWVIPKDDNLLEEVVSLVEYPTAFSGSFAEKYLVLPKEVLITSMKDHQRYFQVTDQKGDLLPYFVSVRNGNTDYIENVRKGNEKVLVARLEDGLFFYEEDKKIAIEQSVKRLETIAFHAEIGSLADKMNNTEQIATLLAEVFSLQPEKVAQLKRAAHIYKFDLVSNMVGEFPELQGIMGEKYALMAGEDPEVAIAIREHYLPLTSEGKLPESEIGAILAIADKLDSIISFFKQEMIPTGSNDPYALRRQMIGIVQIIESRNWSFSLGQLLQLILKNVYGLKEPAQIEKLITEIAHFAKNRILQKLQTYQIAHDIQEAILHAKNDDLLALIKQARVLNRHHGDTDFKEVIEALARVINISKNVNKELVIDADLFETTSEKNLYVQANHLATIWDSATIEEKYTALENLAPYIVNYFDENMVMVDDSKIKENRLNTLAFVANFILDFADVRKIVTK